MEVLDPSCLKLDINLSIPQAAFNNSIQSLVSFTKVERLGIAVSGGADSLALTLLMREWCKINNHSLIGVTVDHHLRTESTQEAKRVHNWLSHYGIEHHIIEWDIKPLIGQKITHDEAREARYNLLIRWCERHDITYLLTGHHKDDLAETVLMRFINGSGVDGLSGIAPLVITPNVKILRPLLSFSKSSLKAFLKGCHQSWIEDPSNNKRNYKRTRIRQLMHEEGLTTSRLVATCSKMIQTRDYLEKETIVWLDKNAHLEELGYYLVNFQSFLSLHPELQTRVLKNVLQTIGGKIFSPRDKGIKVLTSILNSEFKTSTLHGCILSMWRGRLLVSREHRSIMRACSLDSMRVNYWDNRFKIEVKLDDLEIDKLGHESLAVLKERINDEKLKTLPSIVKSTLPTIYRHRKVIALPLLGWNPEGIPIKISFISASSLFKPIFIIA